MKRHETQRIGRGLLFLLFAAAALFAVAPYALLDPAYSRVKINPDVPAHFPLLLVHIFTSFLALATGWLQFIPSLRAKSLRFHRLIGRVYLACTAVGGITGLIVGMYTESFVRQLAFMTLAALWLITGWKGYKAIRQRRIEEHRLWMLRSYAVTLVAATARIVTPFCLLAYIAAHGGAPEGGVKAVLEPVLEVNIWVGLVLNVLVCEWAIARRPQS